jgi:hypothetical protein
MAECLDYGAGRICFIFRPELDRDQNMFWIVTDSFRLLAGRDLREITTSVDLPQFDYAEKIRNEINLLQFGFGLPEIFHRDLNKEVKQSNGCNSDT